MTKNLALITVGAASTMIVLARLVPSAAQQPTQTETTCSAQLDIVRNYAMIDEQMIVRLRTELAAVRAELTEAQKKLEEHGR